MDGLQRQTKGMGCPFLHRMFEVRTKAEFFRKQDALHTMPYLRTLRKGPRNISSKTLPTSFCQIRLYLVEFHTHSVDHLVTPQKRTQRSTHSVAGTVALKTRTTFELSNFIAPQLDHIPSLNLSFAFLEVRETLTF